MNPTIGRLNCSYFYVSMLMWYRHIAKFVNGADFKTLFQLSQPLSPHLAAQKDGKVWRYHALIKHLLKNF